MESINNLKLGKVIVVSSIYIRLVWASKLFSSANTIMDQSFQILTKAEDPTVSWFNYFWSAFTPAPLKLGHSLYLTCILALYKKAALTKPNFQVT